MDIHCKRGASLNLGFAFQNDDGTPFTLSSTGTLSSDVVDANGNLVEHLPIMIDSSGPNLAYVQVNDTSAWPVGQLRCDVVIQQDGLGLWTDTFAIYIDPPVTVLSGA